MVVNVLKFGDPNHDPSLLGHVGCHPEILKGFFATTESQADLVEMLRILVESKDSIGNWHGGLLQQEPPPTALLE